ncbi:family 78 glycoside hydrolase catalytic domain [Paludisphaera rhizosphaerae]|uniref:family 78 glycoside hydrolase catalytic domain n=1 Tax=Paludisphaera rhizosphaerae TaxID=2711216 RepID=UPI0013EA9A19|nr:family 78 glycoside hydrolase catalytic domain [Paludisphaera rhizosphaerae]
MRFSLLRSVVLVPLALSSTLASGAAPLEPAPAGLMCELLAYPERTAITDPSPEFSWIVRSSGKDDVQTAYQIRVAATVEALERPTDALWDSGKVASDRSVAVSYAGRPLESDRTYHWQVRTWNKDDHESGWSTPQAFRTGKLAPAHSTALYPLEQVEIAPASVTRTAEGRDFFDFGRSAFGGLKLMLTAPAGGSKVVVHLGEKLSAPQTIDRKPPGSVRYQRVELTLQPGKQTYIVPFRAEDKRRMPDAIGAVMPFRYVEIEGAAGPLDRESARQVAAFYRFDDSAARFTSSDARLNAVWDLCKYSMKATNFCGVFVDGDRERLPYEADAYINMLGYYACDREFTISRHSHEYLMVNPTWPPEWKHHSVFMAWFDYLYTGDAESLAAFYDKLKGEKLLADRARGDGLLDTKGLRDLVDWPMSERDGYEMKPVNTVYNAFYARSLSLMSEIAAALDKSEDASKFRAEAARVTAAINEKLVDRATGLYVDGEGSKHSSLHANMFPLAFGLVPAERKAKVVDFVKSRGMACSVYAAQYLMDALYDAGEADHALSLTTAKNDRSWSHMVEGVGTTIALEAWDQKYKPNQDWNHAWGAAPANVIPRKLMGIEPTEPGFRTVRIRPQPGDLKWAAMVLPTIRGPIQADFTSAPAEFVLNVDLPANMKGRVEVPRPTAAGDVKVTVDGSPREVKTEGNFLVLEGIGSGQHRIVRTSH